MRWIAAWALALLTLMGCATTREIRVTAEPPDAAIAVDGITRGRGPITEKLTFHGDDVHRVTASRLGYTPQTVDLTRNFDKHELNIALQPRTRQVALHVTPVPAVITVDGKPLGDAPTQDATITLRFTVDDKNEWTQHDVQATRAGYQAAEQVIKWEDNATEYLLALDAMRKDLAITTAPPGASVTLDGKSLGRSPVMARAVAFPADPKTGKIPARKVVVSKPGYDPVQTTIGWDDGRQSYSVELAPKIKTVRIATDPPGATVRIDGQELARNDAGISTATLAFTPVDDKGTLKTYNAIVSKKTADSEWVPEELTIAWDNGKSDYSAMLTEVKTRPVALLRARPVRTDEGWQVVPETSDTLAMKDVTEGPTAEPPVQLISVPRGSAVDSLTVSPDGQWLVFTTLSGGGKAADVKAQMRMIHTDGSGTPTVLGDAHSIDLQPAFTPDGSQIVFASNRGGRHLGIWQVGIAAEATATQLTSGDTSDLWPSIDSDPRPRLYYEALVDSRPDPRLYMSQLGTTLRTDLTQGGGEQPRVSPKADAVIFTRPNPKTGKREIYRISDRGGAAGNLTASPEFDNYDPVWSKDGNKIAFASDRGVDADGRHNYDIWVADLRHPEQPTQVTTNGSWDDCPAWDPSGKYLYFRSNRGGGWAIWRIDVSHILSAQASPPAPAAADTSSRP